MELEQGRSHTDTIRAASAFASEDSKTSWLHCLSTAGLVGIGFCCTLLSPSVFVAIPLAIVTALVLVRLFVIYHDYQHGAILRDSKLATAFMWVVGLISAAPVSVWKSSHNYHHRNNSKLRSAHIGSYPIMTTNSWADASWGARLRYRLVRHPLTILCAYPLGFLWGMCLGPFLRNPKRHWDGLVALALHALAAWALLSFLGWQAFLVGQVLIYVLGSCLGAYLFYAQHNFPGVRHFSADEWNYYDAALQSSSFIRTNRLMHWFTANIGYHHIHHFNHRIPFYRLPQAMAAVPAFQNPATTSFSPLAIWRCLRLGLWDPESQMMVPYNWRDRAAAPAVEASVTLSPTERAKTTA